MTDRTVPLIILSWFFIFISQFPVKMSNKDCQGNAAADKEGESYRQSCDDTWKQSKQLVNSGKIVITVFVGIVGMLIKIS